MDTQQVRILIAEDESIIALDIKNILEKSGYQIISVVSNGDEALKILSAERSDLVLMDIHLGENKNGIEVAEVINKNYSIPVIYLTALTDDETFQRAQKTEPLGYILKPFDDKTLLAAVEKALDKNSIEVELKKKSCEPGNGKVKNEGLPDYVMPELRNKGVVSPRLYENISILFSDFEAVNEDMDDIPPDVFLNELNDIFIHMDIITKKYGLEKLKTAGDIYLIYGGISYDSGDHARRMIMAAIEMLTYLEHRNMHSEYKWSMRAGINTGKVVAGIVGVNERIYDIWGDAVNIASRMETSADHGKINISGATYQYIKDGCGPACPVVRQATRSWWYRSARPFSPCCCQ
ncbi:MAG: adenylate/guanylate cyclase domain-containing protein [Ignavibacteriaceae bacterium]